MEQALLVDISDTETLQDIVLTSDKFLIGRGLHNTRVIEEISISRTHCVLEQNGADWCITDKSSNGTKLNGELLDKTRSHKLADGDIIGLSETIKFKFTKPNQGTTLSENDILDIAESVIAEVDALNEEFFSDKFDGTDANEARTNPSLSVSDINKQNTSLSNVTMTFGPINIHNPAVVNIVQKSAVSDNLQRPIRSTVIQQSLGSDCTKPGSSTVIQPELTATSQEASCSKVDPKMHEQKNNLEHVEDELQCSICTEMFVKAVTLSCSHTFCKFCITQWQKNQTVCPICRSIITMQFPTLVVDNFIEKVLESASEEVKQQRRALIAEREALARPPPTASTSASTSTATTAPRRGRRRPAQDPIEIESSEDTSDDDDDEDDDDEMGYDGSDWERAYDEFDEREHDEFIEWDEDYNGLPGRYYGGYGHCFSCGERGHWANGCPNRRQR